MSNVFSINQNYPTTNALLVTISDPQLYTIYIFKYSDWIVGRQNPLYSLAQSAVNPDGTWQGVFNPISQTYSEITLPETENDGSAASPYTVVAIQGTTSQSVIINLQVIAPAAVPPSLIAGPGITITGTFPDQTVSATDTPEDIAKLIQFFA